MKTKRIPTEGKRVTPPRNVPRVLVEVETDVPGMQIDGILVDCVIGDGGERMRTTTRLEVYLDRLEPEVLAKLRTPAHERAWTQACEITDRLTAEWELEHKAAMRGMSEHERERYVHQRCNLRPAMELSRLGYPTGIPNVLAARVVSQRDPSKMVDLVDFLARTDKGEPLMSAAERAEFVGTAPRTSDNQLDQSGAMIAKVLERALSGRKR